MRDFWACVAAEFRALGWRCVAYGPEFWLGVAALCGVVALAIVVCVLLSGWPR